MTLQDDLEDELHGLLTTVQPVQIAMPAMIVAQNGSVYVPSRTNYIFVQMLSGGPVLQIFNNRVQPANGQTVMVGYDPLNKSLLQVLGWLYGWGNSIAPAAGVGPHHATHEFLNPAGGGDTVYSDARQLMPLRLRVISGLVVGVEPSPIKITGGFSLSTPSTLDLTSLVPVSGARYVLVYLAADGTLAARAGTVAGLFTSLTYSMIPVLNGGERALAAISLRTGQTTISETIALRNLIDLRFSMFTGGVSGTGTYPELMYFDAGGNAAGDPYAIIDEVAHRLIIGGAVVSQVPASAFTASVLSTRSALGGNHDSGFTGVSWASGVSRSSFFNGARAGGTAAAPTKALLNWAIARFSARAYYDDGAGTKGWSNEVGQLEFLAAEDFADPFTWGSYAVIRVTQPTTTTLVDVLKIMFDRIQITGHDLRLDSAVRFDLGAATNGQVPVYNSGTGAWEPATAATLVDYSLAEMSNPPSQAELFAALGVPETVGAGKTYLLNDGGYAQREYLAVSDGAFWWIAPATRAAYLDDIIGMFTMGKCSLSPELFTLPHGVNEFDLIWDGGAYHLVYSDYHNGPLTPHTLYRTAATIAGLATAADTTLNGSGYAVPSLQHYGSTWHLYVGDFSNHLSHFTASAAAGPYTLHDTPYSADRGDPLVRFRELDGYYYLAHIYTAGSPWNLALARAVSPDGPWTVLSNDITATAGRSILDAGQQSDAGIFFLGSRIYMTYSGGNLGGQDLFIIEINPATWQAIAQGVRMATATEAWQMRNSAPNVYNPVFLERDNRMYYSHNPGYAGAWYNVVTGWGYLIPGPL